MYVFDTKLYNIITILVAKPVEKLLGCEKVVRFIKKNTLMITVIRVGCLNDFLLEAKVMVVYCSSIQHA